MRFSRFSFYRGEEKTKIWKINLFKVSIFFICLLLFLLVFFPPSENEYICIFCKFGLRAQYFSPLDIGRRWKSPQSQKTNFESISKLTDRRRSISHHFFQPFFSFPPNKTKNFSSSSNPPQEKKMNSVISLFEIRVSKMQS